MNLYPYQQQDLDFFSGWGRSANFSEPGVGKTPVGVRLIHRLEGIPCLIVCPNVVRYHWEDEIKRFWKGEPPNIVQYQGSANERREISQPDVLIVNYELFRLDFEHYFSKFEYKMTLFDEAHRLKNRKAKVTKCAYKLKTKYIHLITGTPITNQFDDIWSYLRLLFPEQFGSYWKFINRYGNLANNGFGTEIIGVRQDRLPQLTKTIQQFSIRRRKKDVLPDLPDKTYQTIYVDLTPKQRKAYEEMKKFMVASLGKEEIEVPNIVSQLMRLRQITLTPKLAGFESDESSKLPALLELLQERKLAGKKTVVMSEFKQWIDILENKLNTHNISTVRITGAEDHFEQRRSQQTFQNGKADVALCTIRAAGLGIDLTASDMIIFTDIAWNDTDNKQAEDRIHRATQKGNAQIVRLFAKDTLDHVILNRTILKAITAGQILSEDIQHLEQLLSA
nr:DEAD/DEAH box helicase [Pueribacillus theae]